MIGQYRAMYVCVWDRVLAGLRNAENCVLYMTCVRVYFETEFSHENYWLMYIPYWNPES